MVLEMRWMKRTLSRRNVLLALLFGLIHPGAFRDQALAAVESPSNVLTITLAEDSKNLRISAAKGRHETSTERIDIADFRRKGQGARPEIALFLTRKKLWETYREGTFARRV